MLRPFFLIGIGGSGGKTLRVVREALQQRLRDAGWPDGKDLPAAWQFLQVDVASVADGDDPDLPPQLPPANFVGLVGPGVSYATLDQTLGSDLSVDQQLASLGGWKPDPNKVQVAITKGAGQYRALGRVVALTRLEEIKNRIGRMVHAITDAEVRGELDHVAVMLGQSASTASVEPVVVVVSSIAGGSGAGALIDVCDVIRSFNKTWLDQSVGILYAPDVFDDIAEAARRGVRPNALATLSELMAGYWSFEGRSGGISESTSQLYKSRKIETAAISRLGPRYPILVGARNADVSYGEQNQVYRGMGVAISEWITSEQLQDQMVSYVFGNWAATASSVTDRLGLKQLHQETPFSAFGFARLSLGRDVFATYAAQYLARKAAERILTQHLKHRGSDDTRTDDELISVIADNRWPTFLDRSGLDERGAERNQIIDAIRPPETRDTGNRWIAQTQQRISNGVPADGLTAAEWQSRIENELKLNGPAMVDELTGRQKARAREWVRTIQKTLPELVCQFIAQEGAQVTLRLLRQLDMEMDTIARELPEERQQHGLKAEKARSEISARLSVGGAKLPATADPVNQAVRIAAANLFYLAEASLSGLTEEVVRDIKAGLIAPLITAVGNGLQRLQADARPRGHEPSVVDLWPTDDLIPARLRPARNEFLLDDIEAFPETMRRLLLHDTGRDTVLGAEDAATVAVITDADATVPGAAARPRPLLRQQEWVPAIPSLHEASSSPSAARFQLSISADELLRRAKWWVRNDQREFGRHLARGLADHLEGRDLEPAVRAERLERFKGQLRATLDRGKPLVELDNELLAIVHDTSSPKQRLIIGAIPLPEGSESARAARDVVDSITSDAPKDLFGDAVGQSVNVFWVLSEPYEAVVFSSLMRPIADEWADARMDSDTRQMFWSWRRARIMPEFVPTAPAIRRAMLRGWFTAVALGQVRVPPTLRDEPVAIWTPSGNGAGEGAWVDFPFPFLKPYGSEADAIGAVLGSLIIAVLDVHSRKSLAPLKPYHRLRDLGASGPAQGVAEYETLNQALQRWLLEGRSDPGAPAPQERMGTAADTAAVRRERLEERLLGIRTSYQNRFESSVRTKGDVLSVPRDFELRHDITGALDDLISRIREADGTDGVFT